MSVHQCGEESNWPFAATVVILGSLVVYIFDLNMRRPTEASQATTPEHELRTKIETAPSGEVYQATLCITMPHEHDISRMQLPMRAHPGVQVEWANEKRQEALFIPIDTSYRMFCTLLSAPYSAIHGSAMWAELDLTIGWDPNKKVELCSAYPGAQPVIRYDGQLAAPCLEVDPDAQHRYGMTLVQALTEDVTKRKSYYIGRRKEGDPSLFPR